MPGIVHTLPEFSDSSPIRREPLRANAHLFRGLKATVALIHGAVCYHPWKGDKSPALDPVRADLARHGPQVVPAVDDRTVLSGAQSKVWSEPHFESPDPSLPPFCSSKIGHHDQASIAFDPGASPGPVPLRYRTMARHRRLLRHAPQLSVGAQPAGRQADRRL